MSAGTGFYKRGCTFDKTLAKCADARGRIRWDYAKLTHHGTFTALCVPSNQPASRGLQIATLRASLVRFGNQVGGECR